MKNDTKLCVAVIGCGIIAKDHIGSIRDKCGPVKLFLCDRNTQVASAYKRSLGGDTEVYEDAFRLISENKLDIVHVLTPPDSHYDIARHAIENGANVLIEKPMTLTLAETESLFQLGRKCGKIVCVGHSLLYMECMLKAFGLIKSGKMGRVINVHCFFGYAESKKTIPYGGVSHWAYSIPGGPLINIVPHPASVLVELLGVPEDVKLFSDAQNLMPYGYSDLLDVSIRSPKGHGSFTLSMAHGNSSRYVDIECEKGSMHIDIRWQIFVSKYHKGKLGPLSKKFGGIGKGFSIIKSTLGVIYKVATKQMKSNPGTRELVVRFYQAVREQGVSPIGEANAIGVAKILEHVIAASNQKFK
jgi:predicted dehydrogenase